MAITRRVAAILSADAKGYSRLMAADDLGTLRTLTAYRGVMRRAIAAHCGRLVDDPGDNVLAEFGSVVDTVRCALTIQRTLAQRNAELPGDRRLDFRIGVNVGDVLADDSRLYGDAVNVAARVEALADAGGVCVSGVVYDQVAPRLTLAWEALGERALKNIARPVRVYRLRLTATRPVAAVAPPIAARPASIAVLPFRMLDAGVAPRSLAAGIEDSIIAALASLGDVCVVSRSATARFTDPVDVSTVGRELGVRYVLSGTIRRAGSRVRVGTELADSDTRAVLSTRRIDGCADDIFALHDRIGEQAAATVAPHVREAEIRRMLRQNRGGGR